MSWFLVTVRIIPVNTCSGKKQLQLKETSIQDLCIGAVSANLTLLGFHICISVLLGFFLGWGGFWCIRIKNAWVSKKTPNLQVKHLGHIYSKTGSCVKNSFDRLAARYIKVRHGFPVFENYFNTPYAFIYQHAKYGYLERLLLGVINTSWVECCAHYHL